MPVVPQVGPQGTKFFVFGHNSLLFRAMDIGAGALGAIVGLSVLVQVGWHVAVLVLVYKIWRKVKHLPS